MPFLPCWSSVGTCLLNRSTADFPPDPRHPSPDFTQSSTQVNEYRYHSRYYLFHNHHAGRARENHPQATEKSRETHRRTNPTSEKGD